MTRMSVRRQVVATAVLAGAAGGLAAPSHAQVLNSIRIASGLSNPLFVTAPRGDFNRIFVVEQRSGNTGRIRIINLPAHTLNATPYLSINPVSTGSEQGLLGLAFHPRFLENGYFWVNYTDSSGATRIVRYQAQAPFATSTGALAASATNVLTIPQPFSNHNGGWIGFRPDDTEGLLYIATGDGGSGNDPGNRSQNINDLLGKMLRIDIDGPDNIPGNADDDGFPADGTRLYTIPASNPFVGVAGADEIIHTGLRNHWRNSFDRDNGDLYIADVGQNAFEEISWIRGDRATTPVVNFGWRCTEGNQCTGLSGCSCGSPALTAPIWTYGRASGCSITGGYVYRGCTIPAIRGQYFFADYCNATIWSFAYNRSGAAQPSVINRTSDLAPGGGLAINSITSFGEDADGELYITDQGGEVFKIIAQGRTIPDCNANGIDDALEICRGAAADCNANGVLDTCASDPSPAIATPPSNTTTCSGQPATFAVAATTVTGALTFQWRLNGVPIPDATGATLTIPAAASSDEGLYDVVVTAGCRSIVSAPATLTVSCFADFDRSGGVPDGDDIDAFFSAWLIGAGEADADCSSGTPDGADVEAFFAQWSAGGC